MGTAPAEEETPVGSWKRVGKKAGAIYEATAETTYGRRGGSLYPIVLLAVITASLLGAGASSPPDAWLVVMVGILATVLLGIWVGGGGGRR